MEKIKSSKKLIKNKEIDSGKLSIHDVGRSQEIDKL